MLGSNLAANLWSALNGVLAAADTLIWNTRSQISSPADGNILLENNAGTDFGILQLGGVTNAFPGLKRNGNQLQSILADGSTSAGMICSTVTYNRALVASAVVPYSGSITPSALNGSLTLNVTDGVAFTINAPTNTTGTSGQIVWFEIKNTSGGAMGLITWNAIFKMAAFTNPANGFKRYIQFRFDGTNYIEMFRSSADIPN